MKQYIIACIFCWFFLPVQAQWDTKESAQFQKELDEWYANPETTALSDEELEEFNGLNYFPISDDFIVEATFKKMKKKKQKVFGTSSGRTRKMQEYGTLIFTLKGEEYSLVVLKSEGGKPEYADYLTIAFTDLTSGNETYGGGRYMGVREKELEDGKMTLNFNLAYNPSCAYSDGYSCLIPPRKNRLSTRIEAGVQMGYQKK